MKIYCCSFFVDTPSGVQVSRQIVPVVAQNPDHALDLCWATHGEYLQETIGIVPKFKRKKAGISAAIAQKIEVKELSEVYALKGYADDQIRSLAC